MSEGPSIDDIIANATLVVSSKYSGLTNTDELGNAVKDLFSFGNFGINVTSVNGTDSRFKAVLLFDEISTEKQADELVKEYSHHNDESLKISNKRYYLLV